MQVSLHRSLCLLASAGLAITSWNGAGPGLVVFALLTLFWAKMLFHHASPGRKTCSWSEKQAGCPARLFLFRTGFSWVPYCFAAGLPGDISAAAGKVTAWPLFSVFDLVSGNERP